MKEIFADTMKGKKIVREITNAVKNDLKNEEFNKALDEMNSKNDNIEPYL